MTDEERKAIAEVFRKLSRNENLSEAEALPAKKFLQHLKGFKKEEEDVDRFFGHCFEWFLDKRKQFAKASDAEVINQVAKRFWAYMGGRWAKEAKMPDQPPVSGEDGGPSDDDFATTGEQGEPSMSYKDDETDYAVARERTEAKKEAQIYRPLVKRLKRQKDDVSPAELKAGMKREVDRQNDPRLRQEDLWKLKDAINKAVEKARKRNKSR